MVVLVPKTLLDFSKLEPLDGTNYKCWSLKLLIFHEQLDADYVLFIDPPELETPVEISTIAITLVTSVKSKKLEDEAKKKYVRDNKIVRGHLLNHMNNSLFD
ncbi:UNVERIFIED_CONTAM: hypothetical protein Slati_0078200 [Sesamum latifolium]|uniref:Uncharacterized protein n=1 Tax=Sesamum latifolium TaxID=2727402 RepID=A0AAW2Y7U5_9LAMI